MVDSIHKTSVHPRRRFIRLWVPGIIRKDFWRKFIALCFALLIYFLVSTRIGTEKPIGNIPVLIDIPVKLVNLNEKLPRVSVKVIGSKTQVSKLTPSDIKISAEVFENRFTPGTPYTLKLSASNVSTPFGITVKSIEPSELTLSLEKVINKKVKVKVDFDAEQLPEDYIVGKITVAPSEVWIRGAVSLVQNLESVETALVPLENQTESFEYSALIPKNNNYQVSPSKVTVSLTIAKYLALKTIKSIPIKILEASGEIDELQVELLSTPHVDVTVRGPQGKIMSLKPNMIKSYIDVSSLEEPGQYNVDVDCWVTLEGVKIKNIFPKQVKVKLSRNK
jgi:YbbR domain-containing protein